MVEHGPGGYRCRVRPYDAKASGCRSPGTSSASDSSRGSTTRRSRPSRPSSSGSSRRRGRATASPTASRRAPQPAGPGHADPTMAAAGGMGADQGGGRRGGAAPEGPGGAHPHPARQRLDAQPAHLPRRDLEDAAAGAARAAGHRGDARSRGGRARRLGAGRRAVQGDPPVQGLRVHGNAALPLAVLVLPEPRARTDQRLDGRALPALGGRARRVHRLPGALVSNAGQPEADDRSAGVRRRRQPRFHEHRRQGPGEGQGARAGGRRDGITPSTSPAGPSPWSRTAMRLGPRTCGGCWWTGSPTSA